MVHEIEVERASFNYWKFNQLMKHSRPSETCREEFTRHREADRTFLERCEHGGFYDLVNYSSRGKLGEGTYGLVTRAVHKVTGTDVAIKKIKPEAWETGLSPTTIREISLLSELQHPYIVQLLNSIFSNGNVYLVFEYCDYDLRKYLDIYHEHSGHRGLPLAKTRRFQYQMCKAIEFCHLNRIYHRDMKPQNVLVAGGGERIKIADFGLARQHGVPLSPLTREVVTLWYRSPEILLGATTYDQGVDTWALGCIFAEMLTGLPLFPADSEIDCVFKIFQLLGTPSPKTFPTLKFPNWQDIFPRFTGKSIKKAVPCQYLSDEGYGYLLSFLELNPLYRISSISAANHPWLRSQVIGSPALVPQDAGSPLTANLPPRMEDPAGGQKYNLPSLQSEEEAEIERSWFLSSPNSSISGRTNWSSDQIAGSSKNGLHCGDFESGLSLG